MDTRLLLIIFTAGVLIGWLLMKELRRQKRAAGDGNVNPGSKAPISSYNNQRRQTVNQRKHEILKYLNKHESITSREAEELLDVSSATATRYLRELLQEGRVTEHGSGRSTRYTL